MRRGIDSPNLDDNRSEYFFDGSTEDLNYMTYCPDLCDPKYSVFERTPLIDDEFVVDELTALRMKLQRKLTLNEIIGVLPDNDE